jgi:RNase H-fold protein (predicted Holliday junction resolvase)
LIAGKKTRQTRGYVDQVAAQIILQTISTAARSKKQHEGFIKSLD